MSVTSASFPALGGPSTTWTQVQLDSCLISGRESGQAGGPWFESVSSLCLGWGCPQGLCAHSGEGTPPLPPGALVAELIVKLVQDGWTGEEETSFNSCARRSRRNGT